MTSSSDEFELSFDDIPVELQLKIFSYVDKWTLLGKVCIVCKSWHERAMDPVLWMTLNVRLIIKSYQLSCLLNQTCLLKELSLRGTEHVDILAKSSKNLGLLHSLDIGFSEPCKQDDICTIFRNCLLIETLNCEGCTGFDDACIAEMVDRLGNLRCLNVAHCKFITNEGIRQIGENCRKLEDFNIDGITQITDSVVIIVCLNLENTLLKLKLDGEELTSLTFCALAKCTKLELLAVPYSEGLTDDGLASIQTLPNLRWLQIHKAKYVSSAGLTTFFKSVNFRNLVYLDIESPEMDDQAVFKLVETCPLLHSLLLCWCWEITDFGLEAIVCNCCRLCQLDLTGLFSITGLCLLKIPEKLPHLRLLNLQQCNNVVDDILPKVVSQACSLIIINYYGDLVEPSESLSLD